ncbi:MAG: methionyl-tRNA formyltransferase [Treponema sp.]|nr:methionyl-tRNA formyltransferase [Treponema sp.]
MRVLFAGSPAIAVPSLEALCAMHNREGIEPAGVLTNPDSPKGRHGTPQPTETAEAAAKILRRFEEKGRAVFPILKPEKLDAIAREQVCALKPDLLVSFAYGRIFGPKFLALFPLGGINIHPSLLPKYRGPSPIQAAILNRDGETGITVQTLAPEMDCGDILASEKFQLTGTETADSLGEIMAQRAAALMCETLKKIAARTVRLAPQNHAEASYCRLISKEDGLVDWKMSAAEIDARVRAFTPWPLCRTIHNGRELFILKTAVYRGDASEGGQAKPGQVLGIDKEDGILVQTGEGILVVTELQYQSKKALFWRDFFNGARDFTCSQLG